MSHQPDLSDLFTLRPSDHQLRRPTVRQTSKLAVTIMRDSGQLGKRADDIAHWLSWHQNATGTHPTTVELAVWVASKKGHEAPDTAIGRFARLDPTARKNYIAKGIWDCQAANVVEAVPHGERVCAVNQRRAVTWRLRSL